MKVFISWSGDISHKIALALNQWLPDVLQGVQPFLSSEGIHKGAPWFEEIGGQLDETDFGILCLTPFNLEAPWILFEAGALSKKVGKARVVPLVLGLSPSELKPPLSNFNAANVTKEDILKLVQSVNDGLKDKKLGDIPLNRAFDMWWPELEAKLRQVENELATVRAGRTASTPAARGVEDMLGELLELTRSIAQRPAGGGMPVFDVGGDNTLAGLLASGVLPHQLYPFSQQRGIISRARAEGLLGGLAESPADENGGEGKT